jgi:hypothetical protein
MLHASFSKGLKKLKWALLVAAMATVAKAENPPPLAILIEPKFMHYETAVPIPDAKDTVYVPARVVKGEPQVLTAADEKALNLTYDQIVEASHKTASDTLKTLPVRYVRGDHGTIDFAVIESNDPLAASSVLAPDFPKQFADTIGPDLLVVMPNRYRVYVFSRLTTDYQTMSDYIAGDYLSSSYPVSREIFSLEKGQLRAVGEYH